MKILLNYILAVVGILILPILFIAIASFVDTRAVGKGYEVVERCKLFAWVSGIALFVSISILYVLTLFQVPSNNNTLVTLSQIFTYSLIALVAFSVLTLVVDLIVFAYIAMKR